MAVLLLNCAWKAAALLAGAWVLSVGLRNRSAALRHLVWIVSLVSVALLPLLERVPIRWSPHAAASVSPIRSLSATQGTAGTVSSFVVNAIDSLPRIQNTGRWIVGVWLLGMTFMVVRLLASLIALQRRRLAADPCSSPSILNQVERCAAAAGLAKPIRVLISRTPCGMPFTFGFLRPVILLPNECTQWPPQRLRMVLLHEMAHVYRADWASWLFAQACLALYWFHPLVWMAAHRLREESEAASDDMVLNSGEDAALYAEELLNVIRGALHFRGAPAIGIAMAHSNQLERRFTAMLNETIDRRRLTRKAMLFTTTTIMIALLPLSGVRSAAQNSPVSLSGTVLDPRGGAVPATTVIATNRATRSRDMTATDANGAYVFEGLPAGEYEIRFLKPGFAERRESAALSALGSTQNVTLELGALSETINVVAHTSGDITQSTAPQRIVIGGSVQAANLIRQVKPPYPESAKAARLQGSVILEATIGADGVPNSLQVMNAHIDPEFARAAVQAVSQWRYRPTLLNGQPVEVRTNVTVNFTLAN